MAEAKYERFLMLNKQRWIHPMSFLRSAWATSFLLLLTLVAAPVSAQGISEDDVPPELRPWIPWVTQGLGNEVCAKIDATHRCQWPGLLEIDLNEHGGEFSLYVESDAEELRAIIGGEGIWPQSVRVGGKERPVLNRGGVPHMLLPVGRHEVTGRLVWENIPETLAVGADTAFISLRVDGKNVPLVKREKNKLWLKGLGLDQEEEREKDHVELLVFRQIRDGIPLLVETKLIFQVAGRARELAFATPLLAETLPLSVTSDLAIALEASGNLRVQLAPGRHEVTLLARHTQPGKALQNQARNKPWPSEEVWTFHPAPALRTVELSGLPAIDASRTELPESWRSDGAYVAGADASLSLNTTRRGQEQVPQNRLALVREFWLDEKAETFTVRDHLQGSMHQGWRLSLLDGKLGSVSLGKDDQVITEHKGKRGVELRDSDLNMTAVSRVARDGKLSAVGWSEDADSLSANLHLPPGWQVFSATGVDRTSTTWMSRWDLFDVFYLLVISFAILRLAGPTAGLCAVLSLVLCRGESGAPEYVWLPLLALATLSRLLKEGVLRKWTRAAFYGLGLVTLVMLISFSVDQVRSALYPHLEGSYGEEISFDMADELETNAAPEEDVAQKEMPQSVAPPHQEGGGAKRDKLESTQTLGQQLQSERGFIKNKRKRSSLSRTWGPSYAQQKQFKPDSVVQTGPGIPEVGGQTVSLSWSGPVVKEHKMSLVLVSPWMNRLLTVLRLLALACFSFLLMRFAMQGQLRLPKVRTSSSAAVVFLALLLLPQPAKAAEPSNERLAELKSRLLSPAACSPHCVSVSRLQLQLEDELAIKSEVHVGARSAYRLPGPAAVLAMPSIKVDGKETTAIRLEEDGAYYLRLEEGVHQVELRARLLSDRVTMDVGTSPSQVTVQAEGWSVSGINEKLQVPGGTLTLQRDVAFETPQTEELDAPAPKQVAVPAYFQVERRISVGVTGRVLTRITRKSDPSSPEVLRLKLLPGERLTTVGVQVKDGIAEISFPRQESEKLLESTLGLPADGADFTLALTAPQTATSSETWVLECGVIYRCKTEGLVASSHIESGHSQLTFRPWPGEKLNISATLPPPAPGTSLTIQKATLKLTPGIRTGKGHLEFLVQTSRSAVHTVQIPASAKLESVSVDGRSQAVRSDKGKVRISLAPGRRRVVIEWQDPKGISAWLKSPQVNVGAAGVNFRTTIELPDRRWLLFAGGPSQGPALLFWGYLILIVSAAWLLARLPYAPLKSHQWLLLGLGLTQVPVAIAVLIAGWFFAIGARRHLRVKHAWQQNGLQLLRIFYSLIFVSALFGAVYDGLVSSPDMEVTGAGSHNGYLVWFVDRSGGVFPEVRVLSANIWVWRGFMLLWALWLSRALLTWAKWAWEEMNEGGFMMPTTSAQQKGGTAQAQAALRRSSPQTSAEPAPSTERAPSAQPAAGTTTPQAPAMKQVEEGTESPQPESDSPRSDAKPNKED